MAEQTPNTTPTIDEEEPFIPPYYLLILALAGLLVAFFVAFTQPTFNVVGWGGLGIALLGLIAWVLMAPDQAKALITGRTVRFGGTSLLVTVIVITALIALYTLIRGGGFRVDLTERDSYSLTPESRQAIAGIGADPAFGSVRILAFYGAAQAGSRDRDRLLFEDYQRTSADKITYEYVDPDRSPTLAQQYGVTRPGQIVVVPQTADGEPDVENAELVAFFSQDELTNAILRVSAAGDFRAYFLAVDDGLQLTDVGPRGMDTLNEILTRQLGWQTRQVGLLDLMAPGSEIDLSDPAADGVVLVIPGGSQPLSDDETAFIAQYLDNGGELLIFAGVNLEGGPSLASADNLSDVLLARFGLRFLPDVVLDPVQALQALENPVATRFSTTHYITRDFTANSFMVFSLPHPIEVAAERPEGVTVTEIAYSSENAYSKSDIPALLTGRFEQTEDDPTGPFVLAAVAQNTQTGARVVLFGSSALPTNSLSQLNRVVNLQATFNSLVWLTDFEDFFMRVTIQSAQRPQDVPIFVEQRTNSIINLLTIFILPFGVLAIGAVVWWNSRETAA
jgi:ABC-type uncharacterized transport system involved in gliding motility auxiliary subunit